MMRMKVLLGAMAVGALLLLSAPASAQRKEPAPFEVEGVGVQPQKGARINLDHQFLDASGKKVKLGDFFTKGKPVILTPVYYRCPVLCGYTLRGIVESLQEINWDPGDEFELVFFSISPFETPEIARLKKQGFVKDYGRPAAKRGSHFLTGDARDVRDICDTLGFTYKRIEGTRDYAHGAAIFIMTPDGVLAECMGGVQYDSKVLRLLMVEASEGRQGSLLDQVFLWCFHYDGSEGKFSLAAMGIMKIAGVATLVFLSILLVPVWLRSRRKKSGAPETETEDHDQ
jgi:protein SCO1/2